jgi:CHAT domain-containing protein
MQAPDRKALKCTLLGAMLVIGTVGAPGVCAQSAAPRAKAPLRVIVTARPDTPATLPGMLQLSEKELRYELKLATEISGLISPLFSAADHGAVVRAFEDYEKSGEKADAYSRSLYCLSLQNIGRWGDATKCLDATGRALEELVSKGGEKCGFLFGGICIGNALAVSTYDIGRSRQALAVGQTGEAVDFAKAAADAAEFTGAFNRGGLSWARSQYALALAIAARPTQARSQIVQTESSLSETHALARSGVADEVFFNLAQAHLALGNGEGAWSMVGKFGSETALADTMAVTGALGTAALATLGGPALIAAAANVETLRSAVEYRSIWAQAAKLRRLFVTARAAYATGRMAQAKAALDPLIANPLVMAMAEMYPAALELRGRIARHEGDDERAATYLRTAISVMEAARSSFRDEAGRMGFVLNKQDIYLALIDILVAGGRHAEAFEYAERSKARALVEMLATRQQDLKLPQEAQPAGRELVTAMQLAGSFNPALTGDSARRTRFLVLEQTRQLTRIAPQAAALLAVSVPAAAELAALLEPGEVLLSYFGDGAQWFGFRLDRKGVTAARLDFKDAAGRVEAYRKAIEDIESDRHRALGRTLYETLVASILGPDGTNGSNGSNKLAVVPHGALHYLPWAALPTDDLHYLVDSAALRVLPSASTLQVLPPVKAGVRMLALGNPNLGQPQLDLPGAQREVGDIARLRPGTTIRMRNDASETLLKQTGSEYGLLHIASHGAFDGRHPMDSALYLASSDQDDGRLTVGELYRQNFNAQLATLSACETGLGQLAGGDDVVGLNRGFFYAGVPSVVSSLWQVSDDATGKLMVAFYTALAQNDIRSALQTAQLSLRQGEFRHPYYWAAFQLAGRGGPLALAP